MPSSVRLTLDDMAAGGDAVGRHEGQVIFVPLALPGETVQVRLMEQRKSFARGELVAIESPSPERVTPPCPYFGRCGGCQWQHASYTAQLAYKERIVHGQLVRIGKQEDPVVRPMLGMADPWRYRNHVQLRVTSEGRVGYYALKSHTIVPVAECPIAHEQLLPMWSALDDCGARADLLSLRAGVHTGEQLALIEGQEQKPPTPPEALPYSCLYRAPNGAKHLLSGRDHYHEELLGRRLRVSAGAFFQVNTLQAERMIVLLREYLQLEADETLLDAFCGVGALGLLLATEGVRLLGIESWEPSVRDAVHNAQGQGTFWVGDVAEVLAHRRPAADAIVLDPPRAGCTPETLAALAATGARRIAYVSCDPATLARDIARLGEHGYVLVETQPVDLFPQTFHIECVALLSR
jgi:23S rRNA (uracil1939-C5)-methyltransferase